jgi:hypothetical protein
MTKLLDRATGASPESLELGCYVIKKKDNN